MHATPGARRHTVRQKRFIVHARGDRASSTAREPTVRFAGRVTLSPTDRRRASSSFAVPFAHVVSSGVATLSNAPSHGGDDAARRLARLDEAHAPAGRTGSRRPDRAVTVGGHGP